MFQSIRDLTRIPPERLTDQEAALLNWQLSWALTRRENQIPPEGDWDVWLALAGRGWGKTRTAAETLGSWAQEQPGSHWLVAGRTTGEMRDICFEGDSGLLNVIPEELMLGGKRSVAYNKTLFELHLANGSLIKGFGAEKPDGFRGYNFSGGWCDELASWLRIQQSWDMIMFTMRKGVQPRIVVTTTPKPRELIRKLAKGEMAQKVVVTRGSTRENFKNLAKTFQRQIMQYEGTALGRQEIDAEILDNSEAGVIKKSWLVLWPHGMRLPVFEEIIMSLDTAFTEDTRNSDKKSEDFGKPDPTACTVWGVFRQPGKNIPRAILLDAWEEYLGMPELVEKVKAELKLTYGGDEQKPLIQPQFGSKRPSSVGRSIDIVLIEDKGSGISLRQMMAKEGIYPVAYNPGRADKLARLHGVSHLAKAGMVHVPASRQNSEDVVSWAQTMVDQLTTFMGEGTIEHDDFVDSCSQAWRYIADSFQVSVTEKPDPEETVPGEGKRENPYG